MGGYGTGGEKARERVGSRVEGEGRGKVEQRKGKWRKEGSDGFKWPTRAR